MTFSPVSMAKMRMNVEWCVSRIAHGQQQIQHFLLLSLFVSIWHLSFSIPFKKTDKYLKLKIKIGRNDCRRFSYRKFIQKYCMKERRKITKIPLKLIYIVWVEIEGGFCEDNWKNWISKSNGKMMKSIAAYHLNN